jgi:hypothetical protein
VLSTSIMTGNLVCFLAGINKSVPNRLKPASLAKRGVACELF